MTDCAASRRRTCSLLTLRRTTRCAAAARSGGPAQQAGLVSWREGLQACWWVWRPQTNSRSPDRSAVVRVAAPAQKQCGPHSSCAPLPGLRGLQLSAGSRFYLGTTRRQRTAPPFPWCRPCWRWRQRPSRVWRTRQMRRLRAHRLPHHCLALLHAERLDQVNSAHSACMELTPSANGRRRWRPMARHCAAAGRCPHQSPLPLAPLRLPPLPPPLLLPQALHVLLLGQHPALAGRWQGRSSGPLSASCPRCCCATSPRAATACRSCCHCDHGYGCDCGCDGASCPCCGCGSAACGACCRSFGDACCRSCAAHDCRAAAGPCCGCGCPCCLAAAAGAVRCCVPGCCAAAAPG